MDLRAQFESHVLALLRHRPAVDLHSARQLELLCQRQLDAETLAGWRTFWSLATHFFEGLRLAPYRSIDEPEASAASQVLSGLQLREQFNEHHKPVDDNLQVINHLLFFWLLQWGNLHTHTSHLNCFKVSLSSFGVSRLLIVRHMLFERFVPMQWLEY